MAQALRIGVIGAGMMSQVAHLPFYARDPRCRVVALAELRPRMAAAVAAQYGIERVATDHRALLDDRSIDAVVMIAPRGAVGPLSLEVLQSGKHLLTEKPMAATVDQAKRLLAAAQPYQKYSIGFMKRHDPGVRMAVRQLRDLDAAGLAGALLSARVYSRTKRHAVGPGPFHSFGEHREIRYAEWPQTPDGLPSGLASSYAWFVNAAIHDLNLMRHFLGTLTVHAARTGVAGSVSALLQTASGVPVTLEFSAGETPGWQEGVEMVFENASLHLQLPSPLDQRNAATVSLWCGDPRIGDAPGMTAAEAGEPLAFERQASEFVSDILQDRTPLCSAADSLEDLRLAEQIWRAIIQ